MAGTGADCCGSGARICVAEGGAPCGAPESSGAMAGTGADCYGSGARTRGAEGGATCGAPQSTGAMAGTGAECCGSGARILGAEGWAPCGAPLSARAMAGTGADCCGSGARNGGGCAESCDGIMTISTPKGGGWGVACGGAEGGAPLSLGAMAGTRAACGASRARDRGDGGGAVAFGFDFAPYLVLASHFGAIWKSAL